MAQLLWKQLVLLNSYDQKITQCKKKIDLHDSQTQQLTQERTAVSEKKQVLEKQLSSLQSAIRSLENDIDELSTQEKRIKSLLEKCSDQKEFMALKHEQKGLEKEYQHKEESLLLRWHEHEQLKKKQSDYDLELQKCEEKIALHAKQSPTSFPDFSKEYETLQQEHSTILATIPAEWRVEYETMRYKVSDPIVPLYNTSCSACFYPVLAHEVIALKRNAVMHCKNCYRFLYYDASPQKIS